VKRRRERDRRTVARIRVSLRPRTEPRARLQVRPNWEQGTMESYNRHRDLVEVRPMTLDERLAILDLGVRN
jgi:hypothetical protein